MSFVLSGTTITQSGVDADPSGLAGIAGVITQVNGNITSYFVGNVKLAIPGNLTVDPRFSRIIFGSASKANSIDVLGGGVLNVGALVENQGETYETQGTAIEIPSTSLPGCCANGAITLRPGATLNHIGATILLNSCFFISAGATWNTKQAVLATNTINNTRIRSYATQGVVDGLTTIGAIEFDQFASMPNFSGYQPIGGVIATQAVSAASGGTDDVFQIRDFNSVSTETDLSVWRGADVHMINAVKTLEINASIDADPKGLMRKSKELLLTVSDAQKNPISGAKYYFTDTDNGARVNQVVRSGIDYKLLDTKIYQGTSDANGEFPIEQVLVMARTASGYDQRSESNDALAVFTINVCSYLYNITPIVASLVGGSVLRINQELSLQQSISNTDVNAVRVYTSIDTIEQFGDYAKAYLQDNYAGELELTVNNSNGVADCGDYDVKIDDQAASVFSIDGSTITIKSSNFVGDISTTGNISLLNGAAMNGIRSDSNGVTGILELV